MRDLNVGVIGCGYWGPNLIRNFISLPQCSVKRVCDLDSERLSHMQRLYPAIQTTTNIEQVFTDDNIDAIAIATPVASHFTMAKQSILAGKHVFIEKPMASSLNECEQLINLKREHDVILMVGHTFIYCSAVRKIKEIISSGEIGEILYISAQRLNLGLFQKDINVAWDLAPHDLAIILYLLEQLPVSVNCQGKAHVNPGIEDVTDITLDFPSNAFAMIHSSWLDPNKIRRMTIVGSKKMIVYDDMEPLEKIKVYDKRVEIPPHYDTYAEFHYSYYYGDIYTPHINQVEPLKVQCQHFLDSIRHGSKPDSSELEGLRIVQILEAATRSLENGGARIDISDGHDLLSDNHVRA